MQRKRELRQKYLSRAALLEGANLLPGQVPQPHDAVIRNRNQHVHGGLFQKVQSEIAMSKVRQSSNERERERVKDVLFDGVGMRFPFVCQSDIRPLQLGHYTSIVNTSHTPEQ
jgi:hypothetical protein